jgi:tetratricopeptide (TPR) repeat protein
MAQPGISAKIEELQFRLKTDPKSRLFFPLAEELRKHGNLAEAEQVLRTGLGVHATYLSAWVSLGRVLREQQKNTEAVEALTTALQVDPGNVVAARLLADAYLDLGEKVEAIKKYKLVHALMPSDEELQAKIERLDRDLQTPASTDPVMPVAESPSAPESESPFAPESESPFALAPEPEHQTEPEPAAATAETPFAPQESAFDETASMRHSGGQTEAPTTQTIESPFDTGDAVPMGEQHAESPFEEPSGYTAAALEIEQPAGMHIEEGPLVAEVPDAWAEERSREAAESEPVAEVFAPVEPDSPEPAPDDDVTATTTMADLYVRQGLIDDARKIYEHVLQRDPSDEEVRTKLNALGDRLQSVPEVPTEEFVEEEPEPPASNPKVVVLQRWLSRVGRRGEGSA